MIDREKVLYGMSCCIHVSPGRTCRRCPYLNSNGCVRNLIADAFELLKAQASVVPKKSDRYYVCGNCGCELAPSVRVENEMFLNSPWPLFCSRCGRKVKWYG